MVYCTYNMLNIFRALLCPSSGAPDYKCFITAYGVLCLVDGCRVQMQDSRLCVQEEGCCTTAVVQLPSSWILHAIGVNNKHIVSSSWWWSLCCPKYVEHILSAINHSMASSWFFFSTHNQRCTDKHTSSIYVTINENVTLNVNITLHVPTNCTSRNFSSPPPQTHTHTVLIYII